MNLQKQLSLQKGGNSAPFYGYVKALALLREYEMVLGSLKKHCPMRTRKGAHKQPSFPRKER